MYYTMYSMITTLVILVGSMTFPIKPSTEATIKISTTNHLTFTDTKVVRVIDGDTIEIEHMSGKWEGKFHTLRLLDLDTPETFRSKCDREYIWGNMAKERLKFLLEHSDLTIKYKTYKRGRKKGKVIKGRYGRYLAYVYVGSDNVSEVLVREFLGRVYSWKVRRQGWCNQSDVKDFERAQSIYNKTTAIPDL